MPEQATGDTGGRAAAGLRVVRAGVEATLALRQRVLRPWQRPEETRLPGDDAPDSAHFVALGAGGQVVGTVTVLREDAPWGEPGWRLRAMAIDEAVRRLGIGSRLVAAVVDHASAQGGRLLWCNARQVAIPFYERAGFRPWGEPWDEPRIGRHIVMWRRLAEQAGSPAT
ncbi:MAG: GNAT family N-acetyltransferase [Frankia sp.]|nr:GNAT family N-acetyltransferase [Frankia sp.]